PWAAWTRSRSWGSLPECSSSPPTSASGPMMIHPFRRPLRLQVLQDLPHRVGPGTARDAAARMRAGAGQIKAIEQETVTSLTEHRAPREELIETGLGMMGMPARQRVPLFHVERRHDLARLDELAESWRVPLEGLDRDLAHVLALVGP